MKITGDMVRDLQQRIDVTYEEAERTLRRTRGDLDEAEAILKRQQGSRLNKLGDEVNRIYKELLTYYLKIVRKEKTVLDLPLLIPLGLFILMTTDSKIWVGVVTIGIILISESTVSIYRVEKEDKRVVRESGSQTVTKSDSQNVRQSDIDKAMKQPYSGPTAQQTEVSSARSAGQPPQDNATQPPEHPSTPKKDDDDDDYYEITIEK